MGFGKRHDTTVTTDFCPRQLHGVIDFGLNNRPTTFVVVVVVA